MLCVFGGNPSSGFIMDFVFVIVFVIVFVFVFVIVFLISLADTGFCWWAVISSFLIG